MKRIALLVCGMLLLVSNTAEARRSRWTNGGTYTQPTQVTTAAYSAPQTTSAEATTAAYSASAATSAEPTTVAYSVPAATSVQATAAAPSTSTAQGVANLMANYNRVGHWGGNPGYEGCGCGATPAAAYSICCYGNSGMTTVDVGYAQGANGMWYCCRRYR